MDLVAVRGLHPVLCCLLRCWPGLHSLDDHGGAVLPGPQARRHVSGCSHQLVRKLSGSNRISNNAGTKLSVEKLHKRIKSIQKPF